MELKEISFENNTGSGDSPDPFEYHVLILLYVHQYCADEGAVAVLVGG
jgi:hypothetical protein